MYIEYECECGFNVVHLYDDTFPASIRQCTFKGSRTDVTCSVSHNVTLTRRMFLLFTDHSPIRHLALLQRCCQAADGSVENKGRGEADAMDQEYIEPSMVLCNYVRWQPAGFAVSMFSLEELIT